MATYPRRWWLPHLGDIDNSGAPEDASPTARGELGQRRLNKKSGRLRPVTSKAKLTTAQVYGIEGG